MRVGFVGIGSQGGGMARAIARAGFPLRLWARRPEALDAFEAIGAGRAGSLRELGAESDLVGVCVGTDAYVEQVARAEAGGLLAGMRPGSLLALHSTVHPETCRRLARSAAERGVAFLDAPVSGGGEVALQRRLCVMVGGDAAAFQRALPVFESYGNPVRRVGEVGAGQLCKLVNNLLFTAQLELARNAVELARRLGLERGALLELLRASSGRSYALEVVPLLDDRVTAPRALANLVKDTALMRDVARAAGAPESALEAAAAALATWLGEPGARS